MNEPSLASRATKVGWDGRGVEGLYCAHPGLGP